MMPTVEAPCSIVDACGARDSGRFRASETESQQGSDEEKERASERVSERYGQNRTRDN